MDASSIVFVAVGLVLVFDGIYAAVTGTQYANRNKPIKHEPTAYRTWVKVSGVCIAIAGVATIAWKFLFSSKVSGTLLAVCGIVIAAALLIAIISYFVIVKPADRKQKKDSRTTDTFIDED